MIYCNHRKEVVTEVQEDQEKISKRKQEVYSMLKLSNEKLLYEYATNNDFFESRLLKEEILKRMN